MKSITSANIQDEMDNVTDAEDLMKLIKKYPTRIHANIEISIDGDTYRAHSKSIYIDGSNCNVVVEN